MKSYRVRDVGANNRRRAFDVAIVGRSGQVFTVPYADAGVEGLVEHVRVDSETGGAAFEWETRDGSRGTMLAEQVLYLRKDPEVVRRHLLHLMTVRANSLLASRGISKAVLARMAGTSPARVTNLLKPGVYEGKTTDAMLKLLVALDDDLVDTLMQADPNAA
jgi:hypothetical protein